MEENCSGENKKIKKLSFTDPTRDCGKEEKYESLIEQLRAEIFKLRTYPIPEPWCSEVMDARGMKKDLEWFEDLFAEIMTFTELAFLYKDGRTLEYLVEKNQYY